MPTPARVSARASMPASPRAVTRPSLQRSSPRRSLTSTRVFATPSAKARARWQSCARSFRRACSIVASASSSTWRLDRGGWPVRRSREDTAATRAKIVAVAARMFRARGIDATSIADVMSALGLTVGGFYRHFDSKEALVAEAIDAASRETTDRQLTKSGTPDGGERVEFLALL